MKTSKEQMMQRESGMDPDLMESPSINALLDCVPHDSFSDPQTEEKFFGPEAMEMPSLGWNHFPEVPEEIDLVARNHRKLKAGEEKMLFLKYNYCRYRLSQLAEAQQKKYSAARGEEMKLWYDRASRSRSDLVEANMALVLAMAKRTRIPNVDFAEMVSEGNMALLRSVEKFDVSRGFKFSTYACRAILKSFNRMATNTGRYHQRFPVEYDPEMEMGDYDANKHAMQRENTVDSLQEILEKNRANLSEVELTVVNDRFALGNRDKKLTLREVGEKVGLTNERVRQIQRIPGGLITIALRQKIRPFQSRRETERPVFIFLPTLRVAFCVKNIILKNPSGV
jgi:RNA polymerase sigma factor (sigma-70 family)